MFPLGKTVYHKTREHSGTVSESDAATTYFVQANGVEIDFPTRDLTATPPAGKTPVDGLAATLSRVLTMGDITPEHQKVLSVIPQRTLQAVAALWEKQPKAGRFSALNTAQKLNYIAEVTAVPYRTMKQFSDQPSHLGLMMGRGLALSAGSAR
jgi:hypothetical protein